MSSRRYRSLRTGHRGREQRTTPRAPALTLDDLAPRRLLEELALGRLRRCSRMSPYGDLDHDYVIRLSQAGIHPDNDHALLFFLLRCCCLCPAVHCLYYW